MRKVLLASFLALSMLLEPCAVLAQIPQTDLSYGSQGAQVSLLQSTLKSLGYFTGEVTGGFYTQTKAAVQKLQSSLGVLATGYFGPLTRAALSRIGVAQVAGGAGLVAAYNFDENSGTTLTDRSGNGNTGTLTNGPSWVTGKNGTALSFDGSNDYVNITSSSSLNFGTGDFTVEYWANRPTLSGVADLGKLATGSNGWRIYSSESGRLTLGFQGSNEDYSNSAALQVNTWQYVTVTRSSGVIKLYVNGVDVTAYAPNIGDVTNTTALTLGTSAAPPIGAGSQFFGRVTLDDLRLYNRALSASEIQTDMNTPVGGSVPNPSPTAVNGACGTATTQTFSSTPPAGTQYTLCSSGTASAVSGTGPWTWTCIGLNGGTSSNTCTAQKTVSSGTGNSYSTVFPTVENPISEGGMWINGGTSGSGGVGLDWQNVRVVSPGFASITGGSPSAYDDPTAVLSGTWGPDQYVRTIVNRPTLDSTYDQEIEIRLRTTITPHSITGYEVLGGTQIVRWNGAQGSFTVLPDDGPHAALQNGDRFEAQMVGNEIRVFINGVQVNRAVDSTYTNGSPGVGFFSRNPSPAPFGYSCFMASNSPIPGTACSGSTPPNPTPDTTLPGVPGTPQFSNTTASQTTITWAAATDNVGIANYRLERCQGSGCSSFTQIATPSGTSYNDTGLAANTSYSYRVRAVDTSNNVGPYSTSASATTAATTPPGTLPTTPGWYQIPNTTLRNVCPVDGYGGAKATDGVSSYPFSSACQSVVGTWSSGVMDTAANRLIVWGGGHNDYYGNEIYSVDLNTLSGQRLNNPTIPLNIAPTSGGCTQSSLPYGATTNLTPNGRHTYDGLAYMSGVNRMFVVGGGPSCLAGGLINDTWTLDLSTLQWKKMNPSGPLPAAIAGLVTGYDSISGLVFVQDNYNLYSYNYANDSYKLLVTNPIDVGYHMTGIVDSIHKKFVMMGAGEAHVYDISNPSVVAPWKNLITNGGSAIVSTDVYPGLAFDTSTGNIVAWNGGNTVYTLNLGAPNSDGSYTWTPYTYPGGPANPTGTGTYKRFSYSPAANVFVLENDMNQNAYTFRLPGSTPPPPNPNPVITSFTASSTSVTSGGSSNLSWATTNATSCTASGGWSGAKATSGTNVSTGALTTSTTFTLTCSGATGTTPATASVTVTVTATAPPSTKFTAGQSVITTASLNVRTTPSTSGTLVSTLAAGITGIVDQLNPGPVAANGFNWWNIDYNTTPAVSGWSVEDYLASYTAPPPPPPTGSGVTSFSLTSPVGGTQPFTVGLGFKKGDIPGTPVLNIANSQVVVKNRWNDGSVKHAIASGQVALTANTPVTISALNGTAPTGTNLTTADIVAANPQASVTFNGLAGNPTVSLSSLLSAAPFRIWVQGPEMIEAHYRSQVGSDPTMQVWFYVRLYKGGRVWVRTVVENGILYNAVAKSASDPNLNQTYTPTVTIGGNVVWNNGGAALTHYAHTRWTQEGWVGTDPQVTPRLDTSYLEASKLVPNYINSTDNTTLSNSLNALYQNYAPNQAGDWTASMGNVGFQNQIGLLPSWDAFYITSGGDPRAYRSVLANAKALNSYGIVWMATSTHLTIRPDDFRTWGFDGNNSGGYTAWPTGNPTTNNLIWEVAHHGSGGYLAYLITGDYYYLDTMADQVAMAYLAAGPNDYGYGNQNGGPNYGTTRWFNGQTRGYAWDLRTLSQYLGLAPNIVSDPVTDNYRLLLANNMTHLQSVKNAVNPPGIGYIYEYLPNGSPPGGIEASPWQHHFFMMSLGMGSDLEPLANMTAYNDVRDYLYRGIVGILGDSGPATTTTPTGYCFTEASRYTIRYGGGVSPVDWFKDWGQVSAATLGSTTSSGSVQVPPCTNFLNGLSAAGVDDASTGYWGNLLPAISYAVDDGAPGAATAWYRLTHADNWSTILSGGRNSYDKYPIWGILPRTTVNTPPPPPPTGDTTLPSAPGAITASSITDTGVMLAWNPATDNVGVTGYQIYRDGSLLRTQSTTGYTDSGLTPSTTYTYTVNAYDAAGNVGPGATITVLTAGPSDTTPPAISGVAASTLTTTTATIVWNTTNEAADSQVEYGLTTNYGQSTAVNTNLVINHSQILGTPPNPLTSGTLYHYRVKSKDAAGNLAVSGDYTFTTLTPPDTTPPTTPTNFTATPVSTTQINLSWNASTDNSGAAPTYRLTRQTGSQAAVTLGTTTATVFTSSGLATSTSYTFSVVAYDAAGNTSNPATVSAATQSPPPPPAPSDTTAPVISGITANGSAATTTIAWNTNEIADSKVLFGTSATALTSSRYNATLVTTHSLSLTNLLRRTTYYYQVISRDAAGNTSTSTVGSFKTGKGKTSPIGNLQAANGSVVLNWQASTDPFVTSIVIYRSTSGYPDNTGTPLVTLPASATSYHDEATTNGTTYYYSIYAVDDEGTYSDPTQVSFTPTKRSTSSGGGGRGSSWTPGRVIATGTVPAPSFGQTTAATRVPTALPSAIPTATRSTITKALSLGSRDPQVLVLQRFLSAQGLLSASSVTGYFGPLTQSALKRYQCQKGIVCSGTPSTTGYGATGPRTRGAMGGR